MGRPKMGVKGSSESCLTAPSDPANSFFSIMVKAAQNAIHLWFLHELVAL
jgi:hypothetical protein